jgi:cell division protein FtsZ
MNFSNNNENFSNNDSQVKNNVSIGICGVGGGGGNAVKSIMESFKIKNEFDVNKEDLSRVKFIVANTDAQALALNPAPCKIQLGASLTKGFGAGGSPLIGEKSAIESRDEIIKHLSNNDLTFITCGMGGGTGTGAAPVVAQYLQEMKDEIIKQYGEYNEFANYLKVAVVTTPFNFEGQQKMQIAKKGIEELRKYVDTLIIIPNQNLFRIANEKTTLRECFLQTDKVLEDAIRCILDMIIKPGLINVDFADIRFVLSKKGRAVIGIGTSAAGENRAIEAALNAMSNPILDQVSFKKAKALLVSITGGDDLTLFEIDAALNRISDEVDKDAIIIFGSVYDPEKTGTITISLIATGIEDENEDLNNKRINLNKKDSSKFDNSGIFNSAQNSSYNRLFGIFNKENEDQKNNNKFSSEENQVDQLDTNQRNMQKKDLDNDNYDNKNHNELNVKNLTKEYNNFDKYNNRAENEIYNNRLNNSQNSKKVDLVMNEKLQKLGIYNEINDTINNVNNKNQRMNDKDKSKFSYDDNDLKDQSFLYKKNYDYQYSDENQKINQFNQNHNINNSSEFYQRANRNDINNRNLYNNNNQAGQFHNQADLSKKDEIQIDDKKKQGGGIFSKLMSDIPAYLRKKKK